MAFEYIKQALAEKDAASLRRIRRQFEQVGPRYLTYQGRQYLNFASNDYLGMSDDGFDTLNDQLGSTSSALVTGYQTAHRELESFLTSLLGYQACLLFASGFSANASVIKTLMSHSESEIFQDKLNHASLIDGGLAANAANTRFNHNDLKHLTRRLEKSKAKHKLIVSEGVFSMDGDCAPVSELANIAKNHQAWLMIDDAHGFGVLGKNGLGACCEIKPDILVVTFGKAVASMGAAVLCSQSVADYLVQFNREFTYSTAISPSLARATLKKMKRVFAANDERAALRSNITYFKQQASLNHLSVMASESAIQPIILGDSEACLALSDSLKKQGIWAPAIRPPTVPHNTARIRITLTAQHTQQDIDLLIAALAKGVR